MLLDDSALASRMLPRKVTAPDSHSYMRTSGAREFRRVKASMIYPFALRLNVTELAGDA